MREQVCVGVLEREPSGLRVAVPELRLPGPGPVHPGVREHREGPWRQRQLAVGSRDEGPGASTPRPIDVFALSAVRELKSVPRHFMCVK